MNPDPPSTKFPSSHEVFREVLERKLPWRNFEHQGNDFICVSAAEELVGHRIDSLNLLFVLSTTSTSGSIPVKRLEQDSWRCLGVTYHVRQLFRGLAEVLGPHNCTLYLTLTPL